MNPKIVKILIKKGNELLDGPKGRERFIEKEVENNDKINVLLEDLKNYPHAFVLACLMDRRVRAEIAWSIPYKVSLLISGFEFERLAGLSKKKIFDLFEKNKLHRNNKVMAEVFYRGIQLIKEKYDGDASKIWRGKPSSALVVRRFLEFHGVGLKIATMSANILTRKFKIQMKDRCSIDVSPDVHVRRVLQRIGFIDNNNIDEIIYLAKELHPEYPGIFDLPIWEIGKDWCRPKNPNCEKCYLNKECPKII